MMFIILSLNIEHLQVKIGIKEHLFLGQALEKEQLSEYRHIVSLHFSAGSPHFFHGATAQAFQKIMSLHEFYYFIY